MAASLLAHPTEKYLFEFDAFRVDPVRRRLLRNGEPVALTPKALSILLVLLEHRGEVVDKDDLIRRVWPDSYVTEANLTQNISSLRKALGERANEHRYVVTVPGRGYSFVADVMQVPREPTGEFPQVNLAAEAIAEPAGREREGSPAPPPGGWQGSPPVPSARLSRPPLRGRRRFLFLGGVLGFLAAAAVVWVFLAYQQRRARSRPADDAGAAVALRPTIAVLGFRNLSADPNQSWLAPALTEMLITELSAGSRVRVVSGEEVARVKGSLALPYTRDVSAEELRRVYDVLGADLIVIGSYLSLQERSGARIRIDLQLLRAPAGEDITSVSEVGTEENLFDLVNQVGRRVRRSLGWADPSPAEAKAAQALMPSSPEASRLYFQGLSRLRAADSRGARDLLEQAAQADPESAMVRSALSLALIGLGYDRQARQEAERAVQLSAVLPKADRLAIEARFAEAQKDWNRASEIYRSLWTFYPDDLEYGLRLANSLSVAGRNSEALATLSSLRKLPPPGREDPRIDLATAQIARRQGNAAAELQAGREAAAKGQRLGQSQLLAEALLLQGDALYVMGRPQESIDRFHQAQDLFAKAGDNAALARTLNRIGAVLLDSGDFSAAEAQYREALAIAHQLGSRELAVAQTMALAFAADHAGDLQRARRLAEEAYTESVALGEHLYATRSLFKAADVLWQLGDAAGARQRYEQVLDLAHKSGNRVEEARALDGIGRALVCSGALAEARQRQAQALQIAQSSGDPQLAATYSASLAETQILQGDSMTAQRRLESALDSKRRVGDRLGASWVLGKLSNLAHLQGDLERARRYAAEQGTLAAQIRAALASSAALQQQGRLAMASADFAAARRLLSEALRHSEARGAQLPAAGVRLDLARLALLQGRSGESARLATDVAEWYRQRGMLSHRAQALAQLCQARLQAGDTAAAQEAGAQAYAISDPSEDRLLQVAVLTAVAPAELAAGKREESLSHLRRAVAEADRLGYFTAALEARLALGAAQLRTGDAIAGRAAVEKVRGTAASRGLADLARRAAALLAERTTL